MSVAWVTSPRSIALGGGQQRKEKTLDSSRELEAFLVSVEKSAFHIARLATRDSDEALDIVQEGHDQAGTKLCVATRSRMETVVLSDFEQPRNGLASAPGSAQQGDGVVARGP